MGRRWAVVLLALPLRHVPEPAAPLSVELIPFFEHLRFEKATCLAFLPDGSGRALVAEQLGKLRLIDFRPDADSAPVVLDVSDRLSLQEWEEGLLGVACHPDFRRNGTIFVQYSARDPRRLVILRVRLREREETVVLEIPMPEPRHHGGSLRFGPDGFLYIGVGDGGTSPARPGIPQDLGSLLGKFLRIDPDREEAGAAYGIPPDNPFVGRPGARPEIWALGFRNPWGYHFDRETGALWTSDVGEIREEEIDIVRKGANYGWDYREGLSVVRPGGEPPFEDPVVTHGRLEARCLTGGLVYRGARRPELRGVYVYGDYVTGQVWGLRRERGRLRAVRLAVGNQIAFFAEDPEGELYLSSFDGRLYALR